MKSLKTGLITVNGQTHAYQFNRVSSFSEAAKLLGKTTALQILNKEIENQARIKKYSELVEKIAKGA